MMSLPAARKLQESPYISLRYYDLMKANEIALTRQGLLTMLPIRRQGCRPQPEREWLE